MKFLNKYESEFVFLFFKWYFWSRYKSNLYVITLKHKLKTKLKIWVILNLTRLLWRTWKKRCQEKFFVRIVREPTIVQLSLIATQENITDYLWFRFRNWMMRIMYCCRHWMKLSYSMVLNLTWGFISIRGIITVRKVISTFVSSSVRKFLRRSIV